MKAAAGIIADARSCQDLDEVEEWNEYGEIQEQLGSVAPAPAPAVTPSASASNTPSKPSAATRSTATSLAPPQVPPAAEPSAATDAAPSRPSQKSGEAAAENSKPPPSSSAGNPLALAMRQLGTEAAAAATQAKKAKLRAAAAPATNTTETVEDKAGGDARTSDEADSKLDQAAAPGMAPPMGTTEAKDAVAPETGAADMQSKADDVPTVSVEKAGDPEPEAEPARAPASEAPISGKLEALQASAIASEESVTSATSASSTGLGPGTSAHRRSSITPADKETIASIENATKIEEKPDVEEAEAADAETAHQAGPEAATASAEAPDHASEAANPQMEKDDGEQHVKFQGEAPGKEIDRVKATLTSAGGKTESISRTEKAGKPSTEGAAEGEKQVNPLRGEPSAEQQKEVGKTSGESASVKSAVGESQANPVDST